MIDIGGGSTEFVVGHPGADPDFHVSTRLGSVRQTERHLTADPPPHRELEALAAAAREIVAAGVPVRVRDSVEARASPWPAPRPRSPRSTRRSSPTTPTAWTATGWRSPRASGCWRGSPPCPSSERREVPGLHPDRAPTIVAGAAILVESMRAFGLTEVEISEADILHGAALDAARCRRCRSSRHHSRFRQKLAHRSLSPGV